MPSITPNPSFQSLLNDRNISAEVIVDVIAQGKAIGSPLYESVVAGRLDVVRLLPFAHFPIIQAEGESFKNKALYHAAMNGYLEMVQILVEKAGCDVQATTDQHLTAFDIAASHKRKEVARYLMQQYIPPFALYYAATSGLTELVEDLLGKASSCVATINECPNERGNTALHEAVSCGNTEIVALLAGHGANLNARNSLGQTPLHVACNGGHLEVVRALIQQGALLDIPDKGERSCLHYAIIVQKCEMVRLLMDQGAEVQSSHMLLACKAKHIAIVREMLENGILLDEFLDDTMNLVQLGPNVVQFLVDNGVW